MTVEAEGFDAVVAKLGKDYEALVRPGDTYDNPERISTGSPALDWATGGGVPRGRRTRFFGPYSSAKSLTALNIIREAQKMGLLCVYYNIEGQYHEGFVQNLGIDISKLKVVESRRIEEVGRICESLLGVAHVHVFDSATKAVPMDALAADVDEWQRGLKARVWNKVWDRLSDRMDYTENSIIAIDQVRVDQKTQAEYAPGGKGMEHEYDLTVQFKRGKWLYRDAKGFLHEKEGAGAIEAMSGAKTPDGYEVLARVIKSRVGRPFRPALIRVDYQNGHFDTLFELQRAAVNLGILRDKGSGRFELDIPGSKQPMKFHGQGAFKEFLRGDVSLQEEIEEALMETLEMDESYQTGDDDG